VSELGEEEEVLVMGTRFCVSVAFPHIVCALDDDNTMVAWVPRVCSDSLMSRTGSFGVGVSRGGGGTRMMDAFLCVSALSSCCFGVSATHVSVCATWR
jgi:hypothetical protein